VRRRRAHGVAGMRLDVGVTRRHRAVGVCRVGAARRRRGPWRLRSLWRCAAAGQVPRLGRPCGGTGASPPTTRRVGVCVPWRTAGWSPCGRPCGSTGATAVLDALPVSTCAPPYRRVCAHGRGGRPGVPPPLPSGGGRRPTLGPLGQADMCDTRARRTQSRLCCFVCPSPAPPHRRSVTLASTHAPRLALFPNAPLVAPLPAHPRPPLGADHVHVVHALVLAHLQPHQRPRRALGARARPVEPARPAAAALVRHAPHRICARRHGTRARVFRAPPRALPPPAARPTHALGREQRRIRGGHVRPRSVRVAGRHARAVAEKEQGRHVERQRRRTTVGRRGEGDGRLRRQRGAPLKVRHVVKGVIVHAFVLERHDGGGAEDERRRRVAASDRRRVPARARAAVGRGGGAGGGGDGSCGNADERDRSGQLVEDAHGGWRRTSQKGGRVPQTTGTSRQPTVARGRGTPDWGREEWVGGWRRGPRERLLPTVLWPGRRGDCRCRGGRCSDGGARRRRRRCSDRAARGAAASTMAREPHPRVRQRPSKPHEATCQSGAPQRGRRAGAAGRRGLPNCWPASADGIRSSDKGERAGHRARNRVSEQSSASLCWFIKPAHLKRNQAEYIADL